MADSNHLKIVLAGAKSIGIWKQNNPQSKFDLRFANLRRIDLTNADLSGADLRETQLEFADFRWADLIGADLAQSNLSRSDFHKADLTNADLSRADLTLANFEDANLTNVNLSNAIVANTRLINTDLTDVKGLASIDHQKASKIDQETIDNSTELPIEFLRGCGLSDRQVNYSYKRLVSMEVFSDFLEQAEYLLQEGYKDASAVMIGSVLEQNLRQLCQVNDINITKISRKKQKPRSASELNTELQKHQIYNQIDHKNISSCFGIRNCAAHGHYDEYTHDQVINMLKMVVEFLARVKGSVLLPD